MSVLKKMQIADLSLVGVASSTIIGAGIAECQKSIPFECDSRLPPCSIAAR
jgi:hypothetical protein